MAFDREGQVAVLGRKAAWRSSVARASARTSDRSKSKKMRSPAARSSSCTVCDGPATACSAAPEDWADSTFFSAQPARRAAAATAVRIWMRIVRSFFSETGIQFGHFTEWTFRVPTNSV
jgi:hypothetical protein